MEELKGRKVDTDIERFYALIKKNGSITFASAAKTIGVSKEMIEQAIEREEIDGPKMKALFKKNAEYKKLAEYKKDRRVYLK